MVNEKKVRLMTRMAMYEENEGQEDLKIVDYSKKDYVGFQTIITVLWITVGYVMVVGIGMFAFIDELFERMSFAGMVLFAVFVLVGYLAVAISYGMASAKFYRRKYEGARKRMKIFNHDLTRLSRMYDRERE